ncbi:MAG: nuclear transport factor 2 family protein [Pyrinomonadaceae bacterium]|nr:nuclear transport factor 2 family protein [Pyrinomonadaceae bacterium]
MEEFLKEWHRMVKERDLAALPGLLSEDVVFHSPVVHTPQAGKRITAMYLTAAFHVLLNDTFEYVREISSDHEVMLEFKVEIDGIEVNGVDIISLGGDGTIKEMKVMVRPLKAMDVVRAKMAAMLERKPE